MATASNAIMEIAVVKNHPSLRNGEPQLLAEGQSKHYA
jgi:hypothetical protein